ncbi:MAG TPA: HAMP domain-containing sensor histidine kinase, partial [Bacteroidales bacterium]|nr:HAMP domain-containing sensor histidine kinase [Bacteroidales bacterium]
STLEGEANIKDLQGNFLFSVSYPTHLPHRRGTILFVLFMISFVFLNLSLLHLHKKLNPFPKHPNLFLLFFLFDALIIRILITYFGFPGPVFQLPVFDPLYFASSFINPSLGDLIINAVWLIIIAIAFYRYADLNKIGHKAPKFKWLAAALFFALSALMVYVSMAVCKILITDSTLSISFSDLSNAGRYGIAMLAVMVMVTVAAMFIIWRLMQGVQALFQARITFWGAAVPAFLLSFLPMALHAETLNIAFPLLFGLLVLLFGIAGIQQLKPAVTAIAMILLFASGLTWVFNVYSHRKGQENRISVASEFARKEDPMAEFLYAQARETIYSDTILAAMLFSEPMEEELLIKYLLQGYFAGGEGYWSRYHFQVTVCNPGQKLSIAGDNEITGCFDFFSKQIMESGHMTATEDLILMQDPEGNHSYLGVLRFENLNGTQKEIRNIYLEIFPRMVSSGTGYLELMADESLLREGNLNLFSNARYFDGQLVASYGKYIYSTDLAQYRQSGNKPYVFISKGGYSHLYYKTGKRSVLLVSTPEKGWLDLLAPMSVFLLIFLLLLALVSLVERWDGTRFSGGGTFRGRLRLILLGVVLVSFCVVGATSVYYIRVLNRNKNTDNLKDKARSIRIELEHKLADKEILSADLKPYITSLLLKFNEVFATDINLFDDQGNLLGSSREKLFDDGILGKKINPEAFREMALHRKTLLIHEEQIGRLSYLSAYIPFRNNQGKVIAYINLPYFARQSELAGEISSFLMAFINIYLILIALAILIAFALTGMIIKPLVLLQGKIRKVTLGTRNEKLVWDKRDEISELVDEYNRMIDELEKSAELLARSERESAWKEMARQVAHEIKNPLTPMKLNLQYLEKTLADGHPEWKDQFGKYASMMHSQIESLSQIASAFSDFANMPEVKAALVSLRQVLAGAVALFENYPMVHISGNWTGIAEEVTVMGDPEQISRLFINILNNAVQAGEQGKPLQITVDVVSGNKTCEVHITDSGRGIDTAIQEKIFLPNFTTRSSGTGLGLAIARNIAMQCGGDIRFVSEKGKGTTFTVELPVV